MLLNLRDAGGHATASRRRMRAEVLWRGDAPFNLDAKGCSRLSSLHLRTIVDLRRTRERDRRPYDPHAFALHSVSIPLIDVVPGDISLDNGFGEFNTWVLRARGETLAQIMSVLARPGALPALVHCTAGKDRTGIVIALLQAWLGVPDTEIGSDYSLSAELLRVDTADALEKQRLAFGAVVQEKPHLMDAQPAWIIEALDWARRQYGGIEEYLLAHGVRREDLDRLGIALLD